MIARNGPPIRHVAPRSRFPAFIYTLAIIVAAMVAAGYWALPKVRLTQNSLGLARVSLSGISSKVTRAAFITPSRTIRLHLTGSNLLPSATLMPGVAGRLRLTISGPHLLRWLPGDVRTIERPFVTPSTPRLPHGTIHRSLGEGLRLRFRGSVSAVQDQEAGAAVKTVVFSAPRRTLLLPLPAAKPGQSGQVVLRVKARPWEPYSPARVVTWASVPAIMAREAHHVITPQGNLEVVFSQPLRQPRLNRWSLAPQVPGHWREVTAKEFVFTPSTSYGFGPGALVQVTIPAGVDGPRSDSGSALSSSAVLRWVTPPGSVLRLQQLLARERYLPLNWAPSSPSSALDAAYQDSTIYHPPNGTFHWLYPNLPRQLSSLWVPGQMTPITLGAIMQFEAVNKLPVDGIAGPEVWRALIQDRIAGKVNPNPYTYISVTETLPENLELWVGNKMALSTKTNTGLPATPTALGTYAIYERLRFQIMRGKNINGTHYADPVSWINYFHRSDAVHGFVRESYGFPQSLGCVEVPPAVARRIFKTVDYGTLVTVNPVGVAPAPAH